MIVPPPEASPEKQDLKLGSISRFRGSTVGRLTPGIQFATGDLWVGSRYAANPLSP